MASAPPPDASGVEPIDCGAACALTGAPVFTLTIASPACLPTPCPPPAAGAVDTDGETVNSSGGFHGGSTGDELDSDDSGRSKSRSLHYSGPASRRPRLVRLKTFEELQTGNETIDAYAIEIPAKSANAAISLIKSNIASEATNQINHLRKITPTKGLPPHLQPLHMQARNGNGHGHPVPNSPRTLHLLITPTACLDPEDLNEIIASAPSDLWHPFPGPKPVRIVPVPSRPPTSKKQADEWTAKYWPTAFRNTNPFGPQPTVLARAESEMLETDSVGDYIRLAKRVGMQGKKMGHGLGVGVIIVEREGRNSPRVVAAATDARWSSVCIPSAHTEGINHGNCLGHAVLRAIGMVAEKRLASRRAEVSGEKENGATPINSETARKTKPLDILSLPATPLETVYFKGSTLPASGYLCLNLELYITHEPCVMCSMAILHSRFSRVVFAKSMKTGAISADQGGHGLFWRGELNWKLLCWRWEGTEQDDFRRLGPGYEEVHA